MSDNDYLRVKCPNCPKCGSEPPWIFPSMAQAFCINEDCDVLCWTPWDTAEENLNDMSEAVVTETPLEPQREAWPDEPDVETTGF